MMKKNDYNGCKMEPFIGTIGGPQSCKDCLYYQDCYPDDRECMEDNIDDDDDWEEENDAYLAYVTSLT